MEEEMYEVYDGQTLIGSKLNIENAMILIKGYFEKYYAEPGIALTVKKMPTCENEEEFFYEAN